MQLCNLTTQQLDIWYEVRVERKGKGSTRSLKRGFFACVVGGRLALELVVRKNTEIWSEHCCAALRLE